MPVYYTARPIWTNDGLKRVIPRKDVFDEPANLWG